MLQPTLLAVRFIHSPLTGLALTNDVHNQCGSNTMWGHFHIAGDNTGDYQFGTTCINRNEWGERYVFYLRPQ
jgi:hypothetical protein